MGANRNITIGIFTLLVSLLATPLGTLAADPDGFTPYEDTLEDAVVENDLTVNNILNTEVVVDMGGVSAPGTSPGVSTAGRARLLYNSSTNQLEVSYNTAAYGPLVGGGGSSEWTDTGSILHPNESGVDEVAIGGTTEGNSQTFFGINGDAAFNKQGDAAGDFTVSGDTDTDLLFIDASTEQFSVSGIPAGSTAKFNVKDGSSLFSGTTGGVPVTGASTRMMWVPSKAAFRAGQALTTEWDDTGGNELGTGSIAMGTLVRATALNSISLGGNTNATAQTAIALGSFANANGTTAIAIGDRADATAANAVAIGRRAVASAINGITIGSGLKQSPNSDLENTIGDSLAIGFNSTEPTFFVRMQDSPTMGCTPSTTCGVVGRVSIGGDITPDAMFEISQDGDATEPLMMISTDDAGDGDVFTIEADGDVGINQAVPSSKLHVGGTVTATTFSGSGASLTNLPAAQITGQVASANGGTGVSNAGTLTYGANNLTFTTSGVTNITLPTTGTLVTNTGTATLTNKTISAASNTVTNLNTSSISAGTLSSARGGTGVSNTGTITLGANNLAISGGAVTLTATGATNVTLPTTGTLVSQAGTATLTNKTISAGILTGNTTLPGSGQISSGGNIGIGVTPTTNLDIESTGSVIELGDNTAADISIAFDDEAGTDHSFGWDDSEGALSTFDEQLRFRTLQASASPPTCNSTIAGTQWMDTDDGILYICDSSRNKWLSTTRMSWGFGRNVSNGTSEYLRTFNGAPSDQNGWRMMRNGTITAIAAQSNANESWVCEIRRNDSVTVITSVTMAAAAGNHATGLNVDFVAGDFIQGFRNVTSGNVSQPQCWFEFAWRQ